MFPDLVIVKVPLHRQSCAPASSPAVHNTRAVRWDETAEAHVFKLRLPGLKKEDLNVQIDDRILYISYNSEPKIDKKEDEALSSSQSKEKKSGSCSFKRKFKLPENADLEQIKADVTNETLTITVPKLAMKSPEICIINVKSSDPAATPHATSSTTPSDKSKAANGSQCPST